MQAASQDIILSAKGLSKQFSGFMAVKDVDLEVRRGSIHALIGPNGAGKTTCFNLLTKFLQPTEGSITFNGRDITSMAPADIARLGMVRSFQISAVFPKLTVIENVRIALQRRRGDNFDFWRSERLLRRYDDRAIADYTRAIEIDPRDAVAYNNRGIAYRAKGDNDRAIADLAAAMRLVVEAPETMRDACRAASLRYRPEAIAPLWADVLRAARAHADRRRHRPIDPDDLAAAHRSALDWRHPMGHKGPRYPA